MLASFMGIGESIPGLVIVAAGSVNIWAAVKVVYYVGSFVQRFNQMEKTVNKFDGRIAVLERAVLWREHGDRHHAPDVT